MDRVKAIYTQSHEHRKATMHWITSFTYKTPHLWKNRVDPFLKKISRATTFIPFSFLWNLIFLEIQMRSSPIRAYVNLDYDHKVAKSKFTVSSVGGLDQVGVNLSNKGYDSHKKITVS